jgi:ankyrin repeat protein
MAVNQNYLLYDACINGDFEEVEFLVGNGADVSANKHGYTPLHVACSYGRLEVVKFLVDNGADISAVDFYRNTPLHHACMYGHLEVIKFMVDNGVDISSINVDGNTTLQLLDVKYWDEIENYISQLNFSVKPAKR